VGSRPRPAGPAGDLAQHPVDERRWPRSAQTASAAHACASRRRPIQAGAGRIERGKVVLREPPCGHVFTVESDPLPGSFGADHRLRCASRALHGTSAPQPRSTTAHPSGERSCNSRRNNSLGSSPPYVSQARANGRRERMLLISAQLSWQGRVPSGWRCPAPRSRPRYGGGRTPRPRGARQRHHDGPPRNGSD
jgi:hypothetical protein